MELGEGSKGMREERKGKVPGYIPVQVHLRVENAQQLQSIQQGFDRILNPHWTQSFGTGMQKIGQSRQTGQ